MRSTRSVLLLLALLAGRGFATPACAEEFPGARLQRRLEVHLASEKAALRENLGHYGLVYEVTQAELERFMRQIVFQRDGEDVVLGVAHGAESHGGGVLALLLAHWKPGGRAARLDDRFRFEASGESLALAEIYASHRRQVFLPVPGKLPGEIRGEIPSAPQLARMRMRFRTPQRGPESVETDAYSFLRLLAEHEGDLAQTFENRLGQRLSADLLLRHAWNHYLASRDGAAQRADHTFLHLPGLLLAYQRRKAQEGPASAADLDPNRLKRRFLEVELARTSFEGEDWSEVLSHYAESLGFLLGEPAVGWEETEKEKVREWLRKLETERFPDLGGLEPGELCHLLAGLRQIERQSSKLDRSGAGPSGARRPVGR